MSALEEALIEKLYEAFPDAVLSLTSRDGDGVHYTLELYTDAFEGKTRLEQHRMAYAVLGGCVGTSVHALSLKTGGLCDRSD